MCVLTYSERDWHEECIWRDDRRSGLPGHGVQRLRLVLAGLGQDSPIATNETEEGRRENRRVEVVLEPVRAAPAAPQAEADPGKGPADPPGVSPGRRP